MNWRIETKESYYETLVQWWNDWDFPIIPYGSLPTHIYVVEKEGIDLYAIPLFLTNSDICWIGFPTGNKKANKDLKEGALEYLLNIIEIVCKSQGFRLLLTTSDTPKLMNVFESIGFTKSDEGTNFYTKNII